MTVPQSTRAHTTPQLTNKELDRFWSRVDRSGGIGACWPWTGRLTRDGYGRIEFRYVAYSTHRVAYELCVGPIPAELQLDHVKDRGCTRLAFTGETTAIGFGKYIKGGQ